MNIKYIKDNMQLVVKDLLETNDYINDHKEDLFSIESIEERRKRVMEIIKEYQQKKLDNKDNI
jgi:hypothetical protein